MSDYWISPEKSVKLKMYDGDVIIFQIDEYDSVKIYIKEGVELDEITKKLLALLRAQNAKSGASQIGEITGRCETEMEERSCGGVDCKRNSVESVGEEVGVSKKSEICG